MVDRLTSLRSRILALGAGSAVLVITLLAVPVALATSDAVREDAERDAVTLAQGVADLVSTGSSRTGELGAVVDRLDDRRNDTPVAVVLADGTRLGRDLDGCTTVEGDGRGRGRDDRDGPEEILPISEAQTRRAPDGRIVIVSATTAEGEALVCALVRDDEIAATTAERLWPLAGAALAVVVLVTGASLLVARRLARDLAATAATADRLSGGDLDARVPEVGPEEVRRVGAALNRLAGRIDELLTQERETVADLSHRLRTPLTAVRLDVEALSDSAAKTELEADVAQLERTLTAVIQAARRPQREGAVPGCDGAATARERFEYWTPLLEDQGRATSMTLAVSATQADVRCAPEDLRAALDALLENAVAHTPDGTAVSMEVVSEPDGALRIDVRDQGPGVPPTALQRGRSDRGSSGLGLDIARACAEASGGGLELTSDPPWSVVRLVLGAAPR